MKLEIIFNIFFNLIIFHRVPPSRAMTPAQQMDIIRSFEEVDSKVDETISQRDLEVSVHVVHNRAKLLSLVKKSRVLKAISVRGAVIAKTILKKK